MCGIIAFIGHEEEGQSIKMAYEGITILQNRGYDSAGISGISDDNKFIIHKFASDTTETNINNEPLLSSFDKLKPQLSDFNKCNNLICHTRWGTHGNTTSDFNSHPHIDYTQKFSLVHNGIIENFMELKKELIEHNISFNSQTDSEVIVNLIGYYYNLILDVTIAIEKAIDRLEGTWGLVIQCVDTPDKMYCARHGSPLLIGFGETYAIPASEQSGFSRCADKYIELNNEDIIELVKIDGKITFHALDNYDLRKVTVEKCALTPDPYPHWTLKEINEQSESSMRALANGGRIKNDREVKLGGLQDHTDDLINIDNIIILGCGTSYHAGQYCLNLYKTLSGFNTVQIFDGSEFNDIDIPKHGKTGLILLSQSGETKDLHRCIEIAKHNNLMMIGVVNVVDSMIARDVHCGIYLNAGKEVGVASTKAFTSQVIVLTLIAIWFAQHRAINDILRMELIKGLRSISYDITKTINNTEQKCIKVAEYLTKFEHIFLLGKGSNEAIAKEGALKMKEIGYVNSNGYSISSLKHGSYALIVPGFPSIMLMPNNNLFNRNDSVANELESRKSFIIGLSDNDLDDKYNIALKIPTNPPFFGLLANVSLQLIAYHLAILKGNQVDKPRNLAKSVTTD
jgi:glucosamine--fructose-6-phosphate aminotransferase (isomerizing)